MANHDPECVGVFTGLDVGAREIVVARKREQSVTMASFANNGAGHTALLAFLLVSSLRLPDSCSSWYVRGGLGFGGRPEIGSRRIS